MQLATQLTPLPSRHGDRSCFCSWSKPNVPTGVNRAQQRAQRIFRSRTIVCSQRNTENRRAEEVLNKALRQLERQGNADGAVVIRKLLKQYGSTNLVDNGGQEPEKPSWDVFTLTAYSKGWEVPWGPGRVVSGMLLWGVSFVLVGVLLIPVLAYAAPALGLVSGDSAQDKALLTLIDQIAETVVGVGIIYAVTRTSEPLPDDMFKVSLKNPVRCNDGWFAWALLGALASPLVVALAAALLTLINYEDQVGGRGTVDAVAGIITLTLPTYFTLFSVTSILAPILEEIVFRGFLLASLTKFMPTQAAVVVSSLTFAAAHFSARDFPQLAALGLVLGFSYVRSRNLLTPMIIHGVWNGTVLTALFLLVSAGVDLNELF